MLKKIILAACFFVVSAALLIDLTPKNSVAEKAAAQSQCITCHTDVKKLIRLSWEIEKIRPKPEKSVETSGEG